jgi:polyhydroxyalkanoate synthase
MSSSPTKIEAALQRLLVAVQAHASEFVQSLPLRDADVAELNRALLTSEHGRQRLLELQQDYLREWLEIMRSGGTRQGSSHTDRRFSSAEWSKSPWFGTIRDLYELNSRYVSAVTGLVELSPDTKRRLDFFSRQLIDAMSPANLPITNPQAMVRAFQSDGESLAKGAQAFAGDLARGRISMSDETAFEVGRNLAITPGNVVFENELIQLIQYRATTRQIYSRALLIVPPFINKYYILDLQPHNSFVRYCVDQGITTFVISWRNVPEELGHLGWDDYINKGIFDAIEVARSISGSETINTLGYCVGGTLLACALSVKAAQGENLVSSLTLLASMLDFSDTGEISVFVDEAYVERCEQQYAESGIIPGAQLARAFASLRANALVWYFVVNNYLLGNSPRPFDLLYWNADSANLPGPLYAYYLRNMYLENRLRSPGALRIEGVPVDLATVDVPSIVIATREDHIVPWRTAYQSVHLLGGATDFVLGSSGHVAGIINPPQANQRHYWTSGVKKLPAQAEHWLEAARETGGSWWPHWMNWLQRQSGTMLPARTKIGNRNYQPLEAAPGKYVLDRKQFQV